MMILSFDLRWQNKVLDQKLFKKESDIRGAEHQEKTTTWISDKQEEQSNFLVYKKCILLVKEYSHERRISSATKLTLIKFWDLVIK